MKALELLTILKTEWQQMIEADLLPDVWFTDLQGYADVRRNNSYLEIIESITVDLPSAYPQMY